MFQNVYIVIQETGLNVSTNDIRKAAVSSTEASERSGLAELIMHDPKTAKQYNEVETEDRLVERLMRDKEQRQSASFNIFSLDKTVRVHLTLQKMCFSEIRV